MAQAVGVIALVFLGLLIIARMIVSRATRGLNPETKVKLVDTRGNWWLFVPAIIICIIPYIIFMNYPKLNWLTLVSAMVVLLYSIPAIIYWRTVLHKYDFPRKFVGSATLAMVIQFLALILLEGGDFLIFWNIVGKI